MLLFIMSDMKKTTSKVKINLDVVLGGWRPVLFLSFR